MIVILMKSFSFQVPDTESLISCAWLSILVVKTPGGQVGDMRAIRGSAPWT
jgi:hypothetical protein